MKRYVLSCIIPVCLTMASCEKKGQPLMPLAEKMEHNDGTVTCHLNGKASPATLVRANTNKNGMLDLSIDWYKGEYRIYHMTIDDINYNRNESIVFKAAYYKDPYADSCSAFFDYCDDHAVLGSYNIDVDKKNRIIVDSYDPSQNTVTGRFELNLYKDYLNPEVKFDDTLRFTDGAFTVKFHKRY